MALTCSDNFKNIGESSCTNILQALETGILTPIGSSHLNSSIEDSAYWQAEIKKPWGQRSVILPVAEGFEVNDTDPVTNETNLGKINKVRDGKYVHTFLFKIGTNQANAVKSFDQKRWRFIPLDTEGQMGVINFNDTEVKGFPVTVYVDNQRRNDGSVPTYVPMTLQFDSTIDYDSRQALYDGSAIQDVFRLTDVKLSVVGTPSATSLTFSVTNANDGTGVTGLVQADVTLVTDAGADQTSAIDDLADNGDGTYTLATTGLVSGSVNLVLPSALSIDAYESTGAATFTI